MDEAQSGLKRPHLHQLKENQESRKAPSGRDLRRSFVAFLSNYLPANPKACSVSPIPKFGSVGLLSYGQEADRLESIRSHRGNKCLLWSVVRVLIRILAPALDDDVEGWHKQERENGGRGQTADHDDGKWL